MVTSMPDTTIIKTIGRRVWDSRGRPTIEAKDPVAAARAIVADMQLGK